MKEKKTEKTESTPELQSKNNQKQTKSEYRKTLKDTSGNSIISSIINPFLIFFNGILSLIGFDSFFGVGIMIFLVFLLSYSLRILFTRGGKPIEKKKKNKETKKDN